jgi:hypothetical protein
VNRVRRALRVVEVGGGSTRIDQDRVLLPHEVVDRERNAGVQDVHEDVYLLDVDPLARDVDSDVGLVLVVRRDQIDLPALRRHARILDRHLRRYRRAGAAEVA